VILSYLALVFEMKLDIDAINSELMPCKVSTLNKSSFPSFDVCHELRPDSHVGVEAHSLIPEHVDLLRDQRAEDVLAAVEPA
jgi:hypothetical protein